MRKLLIAALAALTLTIVPASMAVAQDDDVTVPDNPAPDDSSSDSDNFDDWGLLGLLGLAGLAGLARKRQDHEVTTTRRTVGDRDTGTGASTR